MNIAPIIVTGMHRSGTSLVSRLLILNNVFLGSKLDINYESVYFQRINKWILSCNGSTWDNPISLNHLNDNDKKILNKKLMNVTCSRFTNSLYFGISNILLNNSFYNQKKLWGWKDPVNIFTACLWKEIYPNCKIINITRSPLNVSKSLLMRQKKLQNIDMNVQEKIFSFFLPVISINKGGILSSFKLSSVNDCLILYKKYLNQMEINNNEFNENILNITYESLLDNSEFVLSKIFDFCNISKQNINNSLKIIDKSKFKKNDDELTYDIKLLDDLEINF